MISVDPGVAVGSRPGLGVEDPDLDALGLAELRHDVQQHLRRIGLSERGVARGDQAAKTAIRASHAIQRAHLILREFRAFGDLWADLSTELAAGSEVDPEKTEPALDLITDSRRDRLLFRYASLLWSVPVSRGFGRRLRWLIRDRANGKLIGLMAIGDPVYNLAARDRWIGWDHHDRAERLANVMDAYVLGAVPPYSHLLGGKLITTLLGTSDVSDAFTHKYATSRGIISGAQKPAHLAAITVTSALGRSSIYNRVKLRHVDGHVLVELLRIGYTKGFGHFQLSDDIFDRLRELLLRTNHDYGHGHKFGQGPNWRIRVLRVALRELGLSQDLLNHGIPREVYIMPLAANTRQFLRGESVRLDGRLPSAADVATQAVSRWLVPRSSRDSMWRVFDPTAVPSMLVDNARSSLAAHELTAAGT